MARMIYKERPFKCEDGHQFKHLCWNYALDDIKCIECGKFAYIYYEQRGKSAGVATDDIPGGILIQHGEGLINPDGSPKRYYSKTDLKRACNENNWTIGGDTPQPYRVSWDGVRKDRFASKN